MIRVGSLGRGSSYKGYSILRFMRQALSLLSLMLTRHDSSVDFNHEGLGRLGEASSAKAK